jgi:ribosome biogenesis GTP-binding protein YsxC/EngB
VAQNRGILQCRTPPSPFPHEHFPRGTGRRLAAHRALSHDRTAVGAPAGPGRARDRLRRPLQCRHVHLHQHAHATKRLAFASKTPGRTQAINLFALGKQGVTDAVLADLPGYGYAAVPKADKIRWQEVMANYLVTRDTLTGIVMLVDPRHGLTELDEILLEVVRPRVEEGLKFLVLLTKADKLNRSEQNKALSIARLQTAGGEVKLFSALKKQGVEEASLLLWNWTHPEPT